VLLPQVCCQPISSVLPMGKVMQFYFKTKHYLYLCPGLFLLFQFYKHCMLQTELGIQLTADLDEESVSYSRGNETCTGQPKNNGWANLSPLNTLINVKTA